MSYTITETIRLETETCCSCGCVFAMPSYLKEQRLNYGGSFFCPNGHGQHYSEPKIQRTKKELYEKQKELTEARCKILEEINKREAAEKELIRHKKRTKNGLCPCCNRSFVNLQKHIKTKHPKFMEGSSK